jgi:hypothetical protein
MCFPGDGKVIGFFLPLQPAIDTADKEDPDLEAFRRRLQGR